MEKYEHSTEKKYEVWAIYHKDQVNYPDRVIMTTSNYDEAIYLKVPLQYTKAILEITVSRQPLGLFT